MSITKGLDTCKKTPRTSSELNNYLVQLFVLYYINLEIIKLPNNM